MSDLLDGLNPPQREAVLHGEGPLLVLAGAGSGKTRVLTHRVARLIDQGVAPRAILATTFTNKAAAEMRDRIARMVGPAARDIWASTFHSACVRILRREAPEAGYPRDFSIFDADDQLRLIKRGCAARGLEPRGLTMARAPGPLVFMFVNAVTIFGNHRAEASCVTSVRRYDSPQVTSSVCLRQRPEAT